MFDFGHGVSRFLGQLTKDGDHPLPKAKIAMLGDGIDLSKFPQPECIAIGKSFIRNTAVSFQPFKPFYLSSTGHGAIVAKLILRACPTASLHVARTHDAGNVDSKSGSIEILGNVSYRSEFRYILANKE